MDEYSLLHKAVTNVVQDVIVHYFGIVARLHQNGEHHRRGFYLFNVSKTCMS